MCRISYRALLGIGVFGMMTVGVNAADRYSSGTITWDTNTVNWADTTGAPYTDSAWNNTAPDFAIFEGTAGTVTLSDVVTNSGMRFDVTGYIITNTVSEYLVPANNSTIQSDVNSAIIGTDIKIVDYLTLTGTGTGTVNGLFDRITSGNSPGKLTKTGSGTWIINGGSEGAYEFWRGIDIDDGLLIANAYLSVGNGSSVSVNSGAEFHYNATNTILNPGGNSNKLKLNGGKLDNNSGAAIVSWDDAGFELSADSMFIGSQGADSDLNLTVRGSWADGKTLTVSNSLTTLTLIGENYAGGLQGADTLGIIKAGAGTLKLASNITYVGHTTVEEGVLSISTNYMHTDSYVYVSNNATLNLDFVGSNSVTRLITNGFLAPGGLWGPDGSGAPNETTALTGSGRLNVLYGVAVPGKRWWEGGSSDISGTGNGIAVGGDGTWDASTTNWDAGDAVAYTNWNNTSSDVAYLRGTAGDISLAEDIQLAGIYLDADADGYAITNCMLTFKPGSAITNYDTLVISSDISGRPTINQFDSLTLINSNNMAISSIDSGQFLYLEGRGTGTITGPITGQNTKLYKSGPGTWELNSVASRRETVVNAGVLIITNALAPYSYVTRALEVNGGEFHLNSSNTFQSAGMDVYIDGGALDNSAGYPITLTQTADQQWRGDFTFLGSGGANSDLDMGSGGTITLTGNRMVTVSDAASTFSVGTVINDAGNGYPLSKDGAGTLKLYGVNAYSGDTFVDDGVLEIDGSQAILDSADLYITNGAVVHLPAGVYEALGDIYLDGVLAAAGSWGSTSSGAENKNDTYFSGSGIIGRGSFLYSSGSKAWDYSTVNWGLESGGPYNLLPWPGAAPVIAVFEGTAGTTTLSGGAVTNSGIRFDVAGHIITNATASDIVFFRDNSTLRCDVASATLYPEIQVPYTLYLDGTGIGTLNGVLNKTQGSIYEGALNKIGTGTWIINGGCKGAYEFGHIHVSNGVLIANAYMSVGHSHGLYVHSGGEFHYNVANTLVKPGGNSNPLRLNGGKLDNSSGSAITGSSAHSVNVIKDSMFIGSQGANSDLDLIGTVTWVDGKSMTVSNAATTLEFSGVVQSANTLGIVKDGAGTLKLSGVNTYTGDTVIDSGALALEGGSALVDASALWLTNSGSVRLDANVNETVAELYLDGVQAYAGTWSPTDGSGVHRDNSLFSGTGLLTVSNGDNITNSAVSNVTVTTATFNGWLSATVTNQDVYVYWGTVNGSNDVASWQNVNYLGGWTNVASTNLSFATNSLAPGEVYYYTFRASNDVQHVWAWPAEKFTTDGPPTVNNSTGASSVSESSATLRGILAGSVSADGWICWGNEDGGIVSTSDWDNVVSVSSVNFDVEFMTTATGLETNATYWYRCFVTNSYGEDWSDTADIFSGIPVDEGGAGGGAIALYTHAALGDNVVNAASGADYVLPWDTTLREDDGFTLGAGTTNVAVEAGHYLVLHNARYDPAVNVNNRREIHQYIMSEGSTNAIGWAQGYTRGQNGQDECVLGGGGIIELSASGNIMIGAQRTDDQSNDDVDRVANASGFQLLALPDSWDYCRLSRSSDQVGPITAGTYVPVQYDVQDELDTGSFGHTSGNADVTLKTAGHYLVFANTYLFQSVDRSLLIQRLTLDGSLVEGSMTTAYIRGNQNGCAEGAASLGIIIETSSANQVLNVAGTLGVSRTPTSYKADKTAVTIVKLPDSGDYIRLDDSGADDFNQSSTTALGWDDEVEIDAGGFTHSDNQITAAATDDYLFLTALYDANDSGQREYFWQRWSTNGTGNPITYANAGGFGRDTSGADQVGGFSGILLDMGNGATIEAISEQLGNSGTLTADTKGLQGVRLGSIISGGGGIANLSPTGLTNTQATLNGLLTTGDTNYTVYVHWGTTNSGTNLTWDSSALVGSWTNATSTNLSYDLTGITLGTLIWYTYRATNDAGQVWASPSWSFALPLTLNDRGTVFQFQ